MLHNTSSHSPVAWSKGSEISKMALINLSVVGIGTGSGSLTHALARSVRPGGHIFTYDFHEQRVDVAKHEFISHGLEGLVTCSQRDVCLQGFGEELDSKADAVFLDLPHPWLVVGHAVKVLKISGNQ